MMVVQLLRHQREAGGTLRSGGEEGRVSFVCPQQAPLVSEPAGWGLGAQHQTGRQKPELWPGSAKDSLWDLMGHVHSLGFVRRVDQG